MGFRSRDEAAQYTPIDDDTLEQIAQRETEAGNPLIWQELARFNWGTDGPDVVDEFMRDQLGCYKRGEDKRFVFSADIDSEAPLLIPRPFRRSGLSLDAAHTLRVRIQAEPPDQFEACCKVSGPTFEFDKSFVRPSVVDDLEALQAELANHPDAKILIMGHTDKVGRKAYNKELSERRARSVHAFITNDVDAWVELADDPCEQWGIREAQMILKDMGEEEPRYDPGEVDGINGPLTQAAVREFQRDNPPLAVDGQYGPNTRRVLFERYMAGKHDIEIEADRFMDPPEDGFMGCGERNPLERINDERDAQGREADEADTEERSEENRRVTFYLFSENRLPRLPCRIADTAPCEQRVTPPARLHNPTFSCSYYDSLARYCSCEGGTTPVIVTVNPVLTVEQSVVLVRKPHTNPTRAVVRLGTDANFDGRGTLTRSSDAIRFFTAAAGGDELAFDGADNVFAGAALSGGVEIFAEGQRASGNVDDITLTLSLSGGTSRTGPDATAQMTSVEVTLDICRSRTAEGANPEPMAQEEKVDPGRYVQLQDAGNNAGRAMLIVRRTAPAAFRGTLVLRPLDAKVQLFAAERPSGGETPLGNPHEVESATISADGLQFWVQGATVSGALHDTGCQLGIRDVEDDGDRIGVTVVEFSQIEATIEPTPANTPANSAAMSPPTPAPANHTFNSTSISEDFATNAPLVLIRNAQPDIALQVTCAPANVPLRWQAIRNPDDHADLGDAGAVPTVTPDAGDVNRAELNCDNLGSFRIRAFVDCNGTDQYEDREPSIPLNLVLANATVVRDRSQAHPENLSVNTTNVNRLRVVNGAWGPAPLSPASLANAGMAMELIADVTGGGADGRLGLDRVFAGLVNNVRTRAIHFHYRDNTVAPPTDHRMRLVAVSNPGDANGPGGAFQAGDPAPNLYTLPLLDSGLTPAGLGGESALMSTSAGSPSIRANRPVGQRWTIRCIDSPGTPARRQHVTNPNATMRQIDYHYEFHAAFCFWTNVTATRARTGDAADRLYSVLRQYSWEIRGVWDVTWPSGNPAVLNATTAHNIRMFNAATSNPIDRVEDHNIEVRPPSGISAGLSWDAQ